MLKREDLMKIEQSIQMMNEMLDPKEGMKIKRKGRTVIIEMTFINETLAEMYVQSLKAVYQK